MDIPMDIKTNKDYELLCESLWPDIFNYINYKVHNKQEAEDLTQDVFIKVLRYVVSGGVDAEKVRSYIFSAARNIVFDFWRKKSRQPVIVEIDTGQYAEENMENKDLMYERIEKDENEKMVLDGLNTLSEEDKDILILRVIEGKSIKEVSELTGKPQGTVKSRQYRALLKLRQYMNERGYYNE